ncbi:Pre-mRNA cleavage complex II Clp1 [Penicillium occitanis (nom. inval.)]|nr:Pre-mRNA cleavage complex II Clp1 [Penicillium occitanis (nom. inval.)]PCH04083.1 hypothetical protein PENOC_035220 [Penicillium occitanis (nom. inval.)]
MSLPGLELAEAAVEAQYAPPPPTQVNLRAGSEWRFEIAFGATVRVKLLTGTAELFGTELAPLQTYTFSGTKAAIYTWHGCTLEITAGETVNTSSNGFAPGGSTTSTGGIGGGGQTQGFGAGGCSSEYVAEDTPMVEYSNVHFGLETMRQEAQNEGGKDGPRVLILGPENAGKTTLTKILTGYATKMDRQPIVVNLDPTEGMLSVPGTLTATAFRSMIDIEEGWGSSPMSGPSPIPVKLPLVYFYPMKSPLEAEGNVFKPIVSRLALSVTARMAEDDDAREAGIIVDTDGSLGSGTPKALELIHHIVTEFSISTILVIGSERLYSTMVKNYDQKPTTSASATHSDERITVLKLSKSGGCVDRDEAFMKAVNESQIRSYFFGTAATSTASSATSVGGVITSIAGGGGSNSNKITLSPHTQQLDFESLALYNYTITSTTTEEEEDEYDPSNFGAGAESYTSLTDQHHDTSPYDPLSSTYSSSGPSGSTNNDTLPLKKFTQPPTLALANSLIAITHVPPNAPVADIRDSSIMGFVYVADVDADKKKIRVLAPVGGRMPAKALVWGKNWPGEVVGLVG